jgi:hypothetical protein
MRCSQSYWTPFVCWTMRSSKLSDNAKQIFFFFLLHSLDLALTHSLKLFFLSFLLSFPLFFRRSSANDPLNKQDTIKSKCKKLHRRVRLSACHYHISFLFATSFSPRLSILVDTRRALSQSCKVSSASGSRSFSRSSSSKDATSSSSRSWFPRSRRAGHLPQGTSERLLSTQ